MTIMVPILQRNALTLQKSQLEFRSMVTSSNAQNLSSKLASLAATGADMESPAAKQLEYTSQLFTQQQAAIDSQLKVMNTNLDGLNKLIDGNIKNDCKLNLLG